MYQQILSLSTFSLWAGSSFSRFLFEQVPLWAGSLFEQVPLWTGSSSSRFLYEHVPLWARSLWAGSSLSRILFEQVPLWARSSLSRFLFEQVPLWASSSFTLLTSHVSDEYNLQISDLQLEDDANYTCQVTPKGDEPNAIVSRIATVTVLSK